MKLKLGDINPDNMMATAMTLKEAIKEGRDIIGSSWWDPDDEREGYSFSCYDWEGVFHSGWMTKEDFERLMASERNEILCETSAFTSKLKALEEEYESKVVAVRKDLDNEKETVIKEFMRSVNLNPGDIIQFSTENGYRKTCLLRRLSFTGGSLEALCQPLVSAETIPLSGMMNIRVLGHIDPNAL